MLRAIIAGVALLATSVSAHANGFTQMQLAPFAVQYVAGMKVPAGDMFLHATLVPQQAPAGVCAAKVLQKINVDTTDMTDPTSSVDVQLGSNCTGRFNALQRKLYQAGYHWVGVQEARLRGAFGEV